MSAVNVPVIRRFLVLHDVGDGPRISRAFRDRDEAIARAREDVRRHQQQRHSIRCKVSVSSFELYPNPQIVRFGVERFDRMLVNVHNYSIDLFAPLDELIECGLIGSYVRDILGKSGSKSSCDEYGNRYQLRKAGKRYHLSLYVGEEPQVPDSTVLRSLGLANRDPLKTDISGILAKFEATHDA